jgi:hypothetical protein
MVDSIADSARLLSVFLYVMHGCFLPKCSLCTSLMRLLLPMPWLQVKQDAVKIDAAESLKMQHFSYVACHLLLAFSIHSL